ncbi:Bestrophin, RFP-TM, chloride channel-domain-containing protein [Blastocladiella britannica]|nr:Bestrophin, RFP-TM, chloride channel-domain-containing protein [Blastocladiella britannica]
MSSFLARFTGGGNHGARPVPRHAPALSKIRVKSKTFGWPSALKYHGTVIPNVAPAVLIFTTWATIVWLIGKFAFKTVASFSLPATFITIISLVLSLLLVFRTNTAYDRYNEGRKLWASLIIHSRNIVRLMWVSIAESELRDTREKLAAINLVLGLFVATRNHLRGEFGLKDEQGNWRSELVALIPKKKAQELAGIAVPGSPSGLGDIASAQNRLRARNAREVSGHVGVTIGGDDEQQRAPGSPTPTSHGFAAHECSNIPVDISHLLSAYIITQRRREKVDVPQYGAMTSLLSNMVDTISNLERVLTSPIPLAYSVHLKQALYIYLFMLPFQLVVAFNGLSILVVFLAAFTMLGVESVGDEIENPFGYDLNDLPIDSYVDAMRAELGALVASAPVTLSEWDLDVPAQTLAPVSREPGSSSPSMSPSHRMFHRSGTSAYDRLMASSDNFGSPHSTLRQSDGEQGGSVRSGNAGAGEPPKRSSLRGLFGGRS